MAGVFVNDGLLWLLDYMIGSPLNASSDLHLRLYENNYTPVQTSTLTDFTEATIAGYGSIGLSTGSWLIAVASSVIHATYPQQLFSFTGAGSIYGYYIYEGYTNRVIAAERASGAPLTFGAIGGGVFVTLDIHGP